MNERLHWLKELMSLRVRARQTYAEQIPAQYRWLATIRKPQTPYAILKLMIDDGSSTNKFGNSSQSLRWMDESETAFMVDSNALGVIVCLQKHLDDYGHKLDATNWWKRHVRRRFECADCENWLAYEFIKPPLFCRRQSDSKVEPLTKSRSTLNAVPKPNNEKAEPVVTAPSKDHQSLEQQHTRKRKRVYKCKICGLPKKGHVCAGAAAPPVPMEPNIDGLTEAPPIPAPLQQRSFDTEIRSSVHFDDIFVPECEPMDTQNFSSGLRAVSQFDSNSTGQSRMEANVSGASRKKLKYSVRTGSMRDDWIDTTIDLE